jgi:hypothetical protein
VPGQLRGGEDLELLELDSVSAPRPGVNRHPPEADRDPAGGGEGRTEDGHPAVGIVGRVGFPDEDAVPPVEPRVQRRPDDQVIAEIRHARAGELVHRDVGGPPDVEVGLRHR